MKKLNLKLGGIKEMLSREQMKKVVGGDGYGYAANTCGVNYLHNGVRVDASRDMSKSDSQSTASYYSSQMAGTGYTALWCCDSCS